jgi:hypothetical protein
MPIHIVHHSPGDYNSVGWSTSAIVFSNKWSQSYDKIKADEVPVKESEEIYKEFAKLSKVYVTIHADALPEKTSSFREALHDVVYVKYDTNVLSAWGEIIEKSTEEYVTILTPHVSVQSNFYSHLTSLMSDSPDMIALCPLPNSSMYIKDRNEYNTLAMDYLAELGMDYYSLTVGYEIWCPTSAFTIKRSLLQDFLQSHLFNNFATKYKQEKMFMHNVERLLSVYVMDKALQITGVRTPIVQLVPEYVQ